MSARVAAVTPIPAAAYAERMAAARSLIADRGISALLVGVGADLRYLTGSAGHPSERPTVLVLTDRGDSVIVAPRLEAMGVEASPAAAAGLVSVRAWDETDDPYAVVASLVPPGGRVLVNADLWARHVIGLQRAVAGATSWGLATEVTRELRIRKDEAEIALLRAAATAADRVVDAIASGPLVGRTEADVSREVRDRLVAEGHDEAAFAIVACGPNSASPHHQPGERVIRPGEPIVLDIGGTIQGYGSDITRTIWVAGPGRAAPPDDAFLAIHAFVARAQAEATAAVAPGVSGAGLDEIARRVIRDGGYGDAFIHRLGHGIGLEGHEDPYLVAGSDAPLAEGMAFSVEPGIYLQGRYGVRIEDIVVCGPAGPHVLNEAPRGPRVVEG